MTGAARGLGLAAVKRFLAEGWRVALLDNNRETLKAAMAGLDSNRALELHCDVSKADQVQDAIDTEFLLESLPSVDKRQFHELVQKSLSATNPLLGNPPNMDVSIDIFTGNYKLIETLEYGSCIITEYFVHVVDSKGKYRFLEDDDSPTEIREVTKFSCNQFTISLDQ